MDDADKSLDAYEALNQAMPSIGILSRKKRIAAFLKVTETAQAMIDEQQVNEEQVLFLLSILARKNPDFQKATVMTALNLAKIKRDYLQPIGFQYANMFRTNLQFQPVDEEKAA